METSRPVVVKRMPERVNRHEAQRFFADVQPFVTSDRPQLVFDLSQVKQLDAAGVHFHQARAHPRGGGTGRGQLGGTSVRELGRAVLPQRRRGRSGAGHAPSLSPDANV